MNDHMAPLVLLRQPRHRHPSVTAEPAGNGKGAADKRSSSPAPEVEALGRESAQAVVAQVLSSPRWKALPHAERKPTGESIALIPAWLAERDGDIELRAALTPEGRKPPPGITVAWDLARGIARIPDQPIRQALLPGQLSTEELIDACGLQGRSVRDVIVRYLSERRAVLDYSSFPALARTLGSFWADIEAHNPGIDSLQLSDQAGGAVASARQRGD